MSMTPPLFLVLFVFAMGAMLVLDRLSTRLVVAIFAISGVLSAVLSTMGHP